MSETVKVAETIENPVTPLLYALQEPFKDSRLYADIAPLRLITKNEPLLILPSEMLINFPQIGESLIQQFPGYQVFTVLSKETSHWRPLGKPKIERTTKLCRVSQKPDGGEIEPISTRSLTAAMTQTYYDLEAELTRSKELPPWAVNIGLSVTSLTNVRDWIKSAGLRYTHVDPKVEGGDPFYENIGWERKSNEPYYIRSLVIMCAMVLADSPKYFREIISKAHPNVDRNRPITRPDRDYQIRTQTVLKVLNDNSRAFITGHVVHLMDIIDAVSLKRLNLSKKPVWSYNPKKDRKTAYFDYNTNQFISIPPKNLTAFVRETLLMAKCLRHKTVKGHTTFEPVRDLKFGDPSLFELCRECPLQKVCIQSHLNAKEAQAQANARSTNLAKKALTDVTAAMDQQMKKRGEFLVFDPRNGLQTKTYRPPQQAIYY